MNVVVVAASQHEEFRLCQIGLEGFRIDLLQMLERLPQLLLIGVVLHTRKFVLELVIVNLRLKHLAELLKHHLHLNWIHLTHELVLSTVSALLITLKKLLLVHFKSLYYILFLIYNFGLFFKLFYFL